MDRRSRGHEREHSVSTTTDHRPVQQRYLQAVERQTVREAREAYLGNTLAQTCYTDGKSIDSVNESVNKTVNDETLAAIKANQSLTEDQQNMMIQHKTCTNETINKEFKNIDVKIRKCPGLLNVTNVDSLDIGGISYKEIHASFTSATNFCECFEGLPEAEILAEVAQNLTMNVPNGEYTSIIDVNVLCQKEPFDIPKAIVTVGEILWKCPILLSKMNSALLDKNNVYKMTAYILYGLCDMTGVNIDCGNQVSASSEFKHCMDQSRRFDVTADNVADRPECRRTLCFYDKMNEPCNSNTSLAYLWAVGMYGHKTDVNLVPECDSGSSLIASFFFIAVASLLSIVL